MIDSGIDAWRVLGAVKPACWEAAASEGLQGCTTVGQVAVAFCSGDLKEI